jgi:hypothetical protein
MPGYHMQLICTQLPARCARHTNMEHILAIYDLSPNHVVLELHERLTWPGRGLEFHVTVAKDDIGAVAWWQDGHPP